MREEGAYPGFFFNEVRRFEKEITEKCHMIRSITIFSSFVSFWSSRGEGSDTSPPQK